MGWFLRLLPMFESQAVWKEVLAFPCSKSLLIPETGRREFGSPLRFPLCSSNSQELGTTFPLEIDFCQNCFSPPPVSPAALWEFSRYLNHWFCIGSYLLVLLPANPPVQPLHIYKALLKSFWSGDAVNVLLGTASVSGWLSHKEVSPQPPPLSPAELIRISENSTSPQSLRILDCNSGPHLLLLKKPSTVYVGRFPICGTLCTYKGDLLW